MPWPIPVLVDPQPPKRMDWRLWVAIFIAVLGIGSAAVLYLWPQGRHTDPVMFWNVLFGLPVGAFLVIFGLAFDRWLDARLKFREGTLENARLNGLWQGWANRYVDVVHATTFLAETQGTDGWESGETVLPIHFGRACGFGWLDPKAGDERIQTLLDLVVDRMSDALAQIPTLEIVLLLDEGSMGESRQWEKIAREKLSRGKRQVEVRTLPASTSLSFLQTRMDQDMGPAQLLLAFQLWHGTGSRTYSEGGAAILLRPKVKAKPYRIPDAPGTGGRMFRPMVSGEDELEADSRNLMNLQVDGKHVRNLWSSGLDEAALANIGNRLSVDYECFRNMDTCLGLPGSASSWITLALALDIGIRCGERQFVAVKEEGEKTLQCLVDSLVKDVSK